MHRRKRRSAVGFDRPNGEDALDEAVTVCEKAHDGRRCYAQDIPASAADCERLVEAVLARWSCVDILLNNAGGAAAGGFAEVVDEAWQADWDVKVMGAVRMMRLVLPHMRRQRDGRIVNITTVNGNAPRPRGLPTSITRAAGINLTKSVPGEYAADNVRVNTICIGLVRTPQIDRWASTSDMEAHYADLARKRVPLGRVATAGEFADLFAFQVSDRASYITGTAINFDGGWGMTV